MPEELALQNDGHEMAVGNAIDTLSKSFAMGIALLYVSGFLIMSLYDFRYGFSEMNPLRPRILAAGGWFLLFLALPFALVRTLLTHKLWKAQKKWWEKAALIAYAYYGSCVAISLPAGFVFVFDNSTASNSHSPTMTKVSAGLLIAVIVVFSVIVSNPKTPERIKAIFISIFLVYLLYGTYYSVFVQRQFQLNALFLWMIVAGLLSYTEMRVRSWKLTPGDWPQSLVWFFGALAIFASVYYPHIKSSWGGGNPIPMTITLTKNSSVLPGGKVSCLLIDETDSGFYVVGLGDKHATYVPRTSVALMHFAGASEPSIFEAKVK